MLYYRPVNHGLMTRTLVALVVVLVSLGAVGGVVADDDLTAERSLGTTTADPGETVPVTMTLELPEAGTVDYVDNFSPAFAGAENLSITADSEGTAPILQEFDGTTALVVLPELGPGTVEISYNVTVPRDIEPGSSHGFDGAVQVAGDEVPIAGDTELEIAGSTTQPPPFGVELDEAGTSESVTAGEELTVAATVENIGNETGTQSVTVTVDDTEQGTQQITLDPAETETVTFTYETSGDDTPSVEVAVSSNNDVATNNIAVVDDSSDGTVDDSETDGDTADDADDGDDGFGPGFSIAVTVTAFLLLILIFRRRRQHGRN